MPQVVELVWFHMKPDESEKKIGQVLECIRGKLLSTLGLEALYYGIGTTIPQGFVGMNIVKIWSSADAQRAYFESPNDYEYEIAKEIIDASDPSRQPNSVSFIPESCDHLFRALASDVTLLSCIWLPAAADKTAFQAHRMEVLGDDVDLENFGTSAVSAWSVPDSMHPLIGETDGFLTFYASANVKDAEAIASKDKQILSRLEMFSQVYDQQYACFSKMM
ncbi:uncharacterized protein CLUP02_01854 [Colletotrichum lupini]|uniref:Uncharacterized protein n=1 Tax=Colletotrichum lupini TaxID=145971 RepID=A0A9Q8W9N9_9PEZI|nr:uncharacterized protein CLUP02_01854 [Colletotrichum lupini]KAK1712136.1 hypothetical protein BDP67DRAFT_619427 [Colletotrichum lupini]UQC75201.1 hypothetical protein CLUP02_01854 [Colletotrichum lupini]